jgi:hypothetical protein
MFDIKWISFFFFVVGGTAVCFKLSWMHYVFPGFVIAHAVLIYDFYRTHKNKPLILQNIYFLVINIFATYNWFKG